MHGWTGSQETLSRARSQCEKVVESMKKEQLFILTWIIHVVRCLQIQGRDGFAILAYHPFQGINSAVDEAGDAGRSVRLGEQFGKCI